MYDSKVVLGDFNLEPTNPTTLDFLSSQNFINLIKSNTCFKEKGSHIDLILTNRKYSFQNAFSYEAGLSDHQHLTYSVMGTLISEELKHLIYRDYSKFSPQSYKDDLMLDSHDNKNDYLEFEKRFINFLNKQAPRNPRHLEQTMTQSAFTCSKLTLQLY